ncbi:MAG: Gfo/Idh/MocA family oxidoreductase [Candidatus Bipolaricaulota bacterium]
MKPALGVAVIGCGHIAPRHVEAIRATAGLELRAVCDVDAAKRQIWAKQEGVPAFADLDAVLSRSDIDVVAICTPNDLHVPMARAALDAGKHAVVEKPVALSARDALDLDRAFAAARLSLFVVLQVRFNPSVAAAMSAVRSGALGRLTLASLAQRWNRRQDYFSGQSNWHGVKAREGGSLLTQGVHYIDLLIQLAGPLEEVCAIARTQAHRIETEDAAVARLVFSSGAMGTLEFTLNVYERNLEASVSLFGESGSLILGGPAANEIALWNVQGRPHPENLIVAAPNEYGGAYVGSPPNHASIYANVAAHLITKTEPIAVTAASAAESIAAIEAIYRSSEVGRPVAVGRMEAV